MQKIVNVRDLSIELHCINRVLYIDSLEISKIFNRSHEQIIKFINELPIDDFTNKNIIYKNNNILITRDGFAMFIANTNDKHSYISTITILEAFDLMLDYISKNNL